MDFRFTDEQKEKRAEFFRVCRDLEKLKPPDFVALENSYKDDACWEFNMCCAREFARRGWLALGWPKEYGGTGTIMDRVMLAEARGYYDIPGVDLFGVQMLAPTLIATGSDEIKKRFLPSIASSEVMWCQLWSEPNAGSDLAALTSTAVKEGDSYVINGQKTWTTGAHKADWGFGVFKTDPTGKKHHNLTFLLLDMKTPGITVKPIHFMDGNNIYNETFFDNVRVPAANMVGSENEGWLVVNTLAGFERSGIEAVMIMTRDLEDIVKYCNTTTRNGQLLSQDAVVRNRLAQIACEIEAAHMLSYRIVDLQNKNEFALMDASAVKIFASELAERFAAVVADIIGPMAQVKSSKWAPMRGKWSSKSQMHFAMTIPGGTNEIQRNIIAWYGLGLPRMK